MATETISETRTAANVIAETARARQEHDRGRRAPRLRSRGPRDQRQRLRLGAILEIAEEFAELRAATRRTSCGSSGSAPRRTTCWAPSYYVSQLSADELVADRPDAQLRHDRLAELRPLRLRRRRRSRPARPGLPARTRSRTSSSTTSTRQGLATEPTAFDGRSDYGPFIAAGIPAGGLFTGAEGVKTPEQVAIFGGTAGEQYDPCYHEVCDTFDNVSLEALDQMSDAAADAIYTFASRNQPLGHGG